MMITCQMIEAWILTLAAARKLNGLPLVSLVIETSPKMTQKHRVTKAACPYVDGVTKLASRVYMLAKMGSYTNKVNNWLEKQGEEADFDAQALWGGKGERAGVLQARHIPSGRLYLCGFPQQANGDGCIVNGHTEYRDTYTGRILTVEEVNDCKENFFTLPKHSPVAYNTIQLENIRQIGYCGQVATVGIEAEA